LKDSGGDGPEFSQVGAALARTSDKERAHRRDKNREERSG